MTFEIMQVIWIAHTIWSSMFLCHKIRFNVSEESMVDYFFDYAFLGPKESKYDHSVGYLSYKGH